MQNTLVKTQAATLTTLSLRLLGWLLLLLPTLALTELVEAAALPTVNRVKDINTTMLSSSDLQDIVKVGNIIFFTANTLNKGRELWKSDGTAAGTVLVKDINQGSNSTWSDYDNYNPNFTTVGNVLYFNADDRINGGELWKSDGTAAGTVMVKDIYPGSSSYPDYLTAVGNMLYFVAYNGINGEELWKSDGTAAGTVMVKDIYPGRSSYPDYLTAVGTVLYFVADNGINGEELWKSDGTAAGTVLVKDINPGSGNTWDKYDYPNFTAVGTTLYFVADNGINGSELWKSDGTAAGTVLVKDIYPGSNGSFCDNYSCFDPNFIAIGNVLYFRANDGVNGKTLWKSDGTTAGTVLVKDVSPYYLTAVGNVLYFVYGAKLWKSNGTAAGTVLVKDISTSGDYSDPNFTAVGNVLYFSAYNGVTGDELWKSDGTAAGTVLVKDIYPGNYTYGNDEYPYNSHPENLTAVGTTLYFAADNGVHGSELWRSDGTAAGTVLVKDIYAVSGSSWGEYEHPNFTAVGTTLYFGANNGVTGYELWKSDGTAAGTVLVKDIKAGNGSAWSQYEYPNFTAVGNMLYFVADHST